jgi:uncharacterized protein DUF6152/TOBE domain-containing protein
MARRIALALPLLLCLAHPAAAHHGWGGYDAAAPVTLSGSVERVEAQGPHATLWLRAADGRTWEVVLAPPTRMANRGLPATRLEPGQRVEVMGYPHRTQPGEMRAEWIRAPGLAQPVQLR